MTSEPLAPGAPAVVLFRQVDRDDNVHHAHEDNYVRIKILNDQGRKYANVEIPFWAKIQEVVDIRARTIRPDGSIAEFDGNVLEKELVKAKGVKYIAKVLTLPDAQVGSIIEYSYTVEWKEHLLFDSHWILNSDLFTKKARFSLRPYGGDYLAYSVRWVSKGLPPDAEVRNGPDHIVRMEATNVPAFEVEDYMPPLNELKARVDFIYQMGLAESDPVIFWRSVGMRWNANLEKFLGKRKAMDQAVEQIVSPNDPPELKLRKIYARVQAIRNTSYEIRKTKQEEKREKEKPAQNVEDVWKRGYGDIVQLNWLFLGLVRAAGFDAYGCWVSSRREYFFFPNAMQTEKLGFNVVQVSLNGKDLYFAPGVPFTPFGLLTWSETAAPGLRLDKDGGTWIRTTLPQAAESRIERTGKMAISEEGELRGKITATYTGLVAMYLRMEERNADEVARKRLLEEQVASQIGGGAEVELIGSPDWSSSDPRLTAEFNLRISNWASKAGKRLLLPAAIFTAAEKGVFEHANRVHPVYFEYPSEKIDDVTVELPLGWTATVPMGQYQDAKTVLYNMKVDSIRPEHGPEALRLTRKLTIDVLLVPQDSYSALRSFFQTVRTGDGEQIVLQSIPKPISQGKESHTSN
ncbi:MAG TPA: DUF3857 domain-containing protein [Terriglobales bacterium]|nr:DUF3857 domain-containing protein [Terriglobales bacterium]